MAEFELDGPLEANSMRNLVLLHLTGEHQTIPPSTYDRFDAWWYAAAPNSRLAFWADFRSWRSFCTSRHLPPAPVGALDVRDYIRERGRAGLHARSIARQVASITLLHRLGGWVPSPTEDQVVVSELAGLRKDQARAGRGRARQAKALRIKGDVVDIEADAPLPLSVRALLTTLDLSTAGGLRDRTLLLVGANLGRRRSEYSMMDVGDVESFRDGTGSMAIRWSKTDQFGEGRTKFLGPETMSAIKDWLDFREAVACQSDVESAEPPSPSTGQNAGRQGGLLASEPLLTAVNRHGQVGARLSPDGVKRVIVTIVRRGLLVLQPDMSFEEREEQLRGISGHSFRVGLAQDMTACGEDMPSICEAADWKTPAMPIRYAAALANRSGGLARTWNKGAK